MVQRSSKSTIPTRQALQCRRSIVRNAVGFDLLFYVLQYSCMQFGRKACLIMTFFDDMNTYADIMYAYGASAAIRHDCHCVY